MIVKTGFFKLFLLLLTILFLTSCTRGEKIVPVTISANLLEECPVPKRTRYRNDYLRKYTVDLHKALLKCNADKRAIKKELGY